MWCKVPKAASTSLLYAYLELAHVPHHQIPEVSCQALVKSDSLMVKYQVSSLINDIFFFYLFVWHIHRPIVLLLKGMIAFCIEKSQFGAIKYVFFNEQTCLWLWVISIFGIWYSYYFLNIHKIFHRITDLVYMASSGKNTQFSAKICSKNQSSNPSSSSSFGILSREFCRLMLTNQRVTSEISSTVEVSVNNTH